MDGLWRRMDLCDMDRIWFVPTFFEGLVAYAQRRRRDRAFLRLIRFVLRLSPLRSRLVALRLSPVS